MDNLMQAFSFELPTRIEYGIGSVHQLGEELKKLKVNKVMIVTDEGIVKAGLIEKTVASLKQYAIKYEIFQGVEANPKDYNVEKGAAVAQCFGAEGLIAVGGGSPIDCAKSIAVLVSHDGDKIKSFEGKTAVTKPTIPLIAIPTTAGSGSEVTFSSVITDTKNNYKMTVKSPLIAPKIALVDPEMTISMPPQVTAATGVDALTHAIEGYTVKVAEPISDAVALYAIELISKYLKTAVFQGEDIEARAGMLMGSLLAGMAFSHADVASVHCMAESLGSVYDAPHGACNAILLPYVMEYNMEYCQERYANVAKAMGASYSNVEEGAQKAVEMVKQLANDVKLPSFKSLGVEEKDFDILAEMSAKNISTESNPRPMTKEDYLEVFIRAYRDK
ncbi:alcohol dehydrogenase [Natronincola peptidivorans]|uniref:Alcohol dehydrogenase n=1 Tax=Natronincola peptidivorans TaxID=426128 RepID=A0A1I0BVT9_9FIRM|nr:iron-containing alcohol dehydrogenase [Natronincola peptidivorans]SET11115.1 alcohol dehydrogenase [Natronincola peptidivorans]